MRSKIINHASEKTYVLILETGEEVVSQLQRFAKENDLAASRFPQSVHSAAPPWPTSTGIKRITKRYRSMNR